MTPGSPDAIGDFVRTWLRSVNSIGNGPVPEDVALVDLGLDSLDVVELSRSLRRAGLDVQPSDLDSYDTVAETVAKIHRLTRAG